LDPGLLSAKIPTAGPGAWLKLLTLRARRCRIAGPSMEPVLWAGDVVVVDTHASAKVGDVVLCRHPFQSDVEVVKRVHAIDGDGALSLRGDNPDRSTDSRSHGAVPAAHLRGVVIAVLG
jgi:nickel-type superoxide dismutase maturation protease